MVNEKIRSLAMALRTCWIWEKNGKNARLHFMECIREWMEYCSHENFSSQSVSPSYSLPSQINPVLRV